MNLVQDIKTDVKSFYSYVRSKSVTKEKVGPLKDDQGNIITEASAMCKILNEYFSSVFTNPSVNSTLPRVQCIFKEDHNKR